MQLVLDLPWSGADHLAVQLDAVGVEGCQPLIQRYGSKTQARNYTLVSHKTTQEKKHLNYFKYNKYITTVMNHAGCTSSYLFFT